VNYQKSSSAKIDYLTNGKTTFLNAISSIAKYLKFPCTKLGELMVSQKLVSTLIQVDVGTLRTRKKNDRVKIVRASSSSYG